MSSNVPLTVGILGLGQIAHGYDDPAGQAISTHIKACLAETRLRIAWVSDIDNALAIDVNDQWNLMASVVVPDDASCHAVDVVCIATPDDTHVQWVGRFLASTPKLILCEKPLAASTKQAQDLLSMVQATECKLVINFMRRWIPGVSTWLSAAARGGFGAPVEAQLTYCRGLRHNACHGLDLIGAAFGCDVVSVRKSTDGFDDFEAADLTVSASLGLRGRAGPVPVSVTGVDGRIRNVFDVDIIFETSRLRVWNEDGIRAQISGVDSQSSYEFHDKPIRHMQYVWKNIADTLMDGAPLLCASTETLPGMMLVDAVANASPQATDDPNV